MDKGTGKIISEEKLKTISEEEQQYYIPMVKVPTVAQLMKGKVKRNGPCPCGSGKKFKKCCRIRK